MKKIKAPALLGAFVLSGLLASATDGKTVPSQLEGYVKDAVTRKPVAGVVVCAKASGSAKSSEAVTDAYGYFRFSELPSSLVNLQFGKKGYLPFSRSGVLVKEKTTVKLTIDFYREEMNTDPESNVDFSEYPLLRMLEI